MLTESPEDSTNRPRLGGTGVLECDRLSPTLPATHSRTLDNLRAARSDSLRSQSLRLSVDNACYGIL